MSDDRRTHNEDPYQKKMRKIQEFKLNIQEDDVISGEPAGEGKNPGGPQPENRDPIPVADESNVIHSYSDPKAAAKDKISNLEKEERKREEAEHKKRNKAKRKKNHRFFRWVWLAMVVMIGVVLAQYMIAGINDMLAIGREGKSIEVTIPKDASTQQIASILKKNGAIDNEGFFCLYSKLTKSDGTYNSGTFKIETNMDYEAIITNLQSNLNRTDTVRITFKEGITVLEAVKLLEDNGVCSAQDALAEIKSDHFDSNYEMLKGITNSDERYYRLEGYLFPDTYDFYKNEEPQQAIQKLVSNCNKKLTKEIRQKIEDKGMTIDQALTLASLVQAEAANEDDMYVVSSVFQNRLNSDPSQGLFYLNSDPTIFYPYKNGTVPEDVKDTFSSTYNTYKVKGLPPGPICNPGMDAIDAVLNPADTNYYYFCHSADGTPYYARTAAQHEANKKKAGLS